MAERPLTERRRNTDSLTTPPAGWLGKALTKAMTMYQFVLAMVLACYVGFSRLYHLRFLEREPMLIGILAVLRLPACRRNRRSGGFWPRCIGAWRGNCSRCSGGCASASGKRLMCD
jgi:hypothetical protein